jgi:hypothetical protein
MQLPTLSINDRADDLRVIGLSTSQYANRDAAAIDRQADFLLSEGRFVQAERLAHLAADLRQAVAA